MLKIVTVMEAQERLWILTEPGKSAGDKGEGVCAPGPQFTIMGNSQPSSGRFTEMGLGK